MIDVTTNFNQFKDHLKFKLDGLKNPETVLRAVATDMLPIVRHRVHVEGKGADNSVIGIYSTNYLKLRERKYNRTPDSKVIISLTRQMENDFSVINTGNGYGLGYKNSDNFEKAFFVEATYNKKIFALTKDEEQQAIKVAQESVKRLFNG